MAKNNREKMNKGINKIRRMWGTEILTVCVFIIRPNYLLAFKDIYTKSQ